MTLGSFRVLQRAALRATTAAPTVFKPVLMGGEVRLVLHFLD
jgi:hypothetical protein